MLTQLTNIIEKIGTIQHFKGQTPAQICTVSVPIFIQVSGKELEEIKTRITPKVLMEKCARRANNALQQIEAQKPTCATFQEPAEEFAKILATACIPNVEKLAQEVGTTSFVIQEYITGNSCLVAVTATLFNDPRFAQCLKKTSVIHQIALGKVPP